MSVRRIVARSERGEEKVVFRRDAAARSVPQGGAQLAAGGFYVLPLAFAHDGRHVFVPQHFSKWPAEIRAWAAGRRTGRGIIGNEIEFGLQPRT